MVIPGLFLGFLLWIIVGQPQNASAAGAVLEIPRPEIEIECMVKDIPESIRVDLSTVEEVFTIGDLELPEGVKAVLDPERHIAHVTIVAEAEETEASEDGEEQSPEVISSSDEGAADSSGDEGGDE